MSDRIKFWLDRPGAGEEILKGNSKVKKLEQKVMEDALSEIQAEFLTEFGFEGRFELQFKPTSLRSAYRIRAADKRTGAILKAHPLWLDKFAKGAKF